jgi:predicted kinase
LQLPASGKTHTARRIVRYLKFFLDIPAEIFNIATYRRELVGDTRASFFDHSDKDSLKLRDEAKQRAMNDLITYMNNKQGGVRVAVLDGPNDTKQKRKAILDSLKEAGVGAKKLFIEVVCDEPDVSASLPTI